MATTRQIELLEQIGARRIKLVEPTIAVGEKQIVGIEVWIYGANIAIEISSGNGANRVLNRSWHEFTFA